MDRYELDNLTRSIAMLTPCQMALDREQALRLLQEMAEVGAELRAARAELERVKAGPQELLAAIDAAGRWT